MSEQSCEHRESHRAEVRVHFLEDTGRFVAELEITCACGLPFSFPTLPLAISTDRVCTSIMGLTLSVPIEPGPLPIPVSGTVPIEMPSRKKDS